MKGLIDRWRRRATLLLMAVTAMSFFAGATQRPLFAGNVLFRGDPSGGCYYDCIPGQLMSATGNEYDANTCASVSSGTFPCTSAACEVVSGGTIVTAYIDC